MLIPAIVVLTVIPFGPGAFAENLDAGIFFALAVSSISTIGLLMAGWASANKFSLMGGLRGAAQLIAYELPMVLAAAAIALQAETLSLVGIVEAQAGFELFGTVTIPYALPHFFGLALFFMASVAELNRPPFDMPIADAELIAGHMTEYTGIRFAFFLLSEYAGMVVFGALATVLFLGGWYPWPGYLLPEGFLGVVVGFRHDDRQDRRLHVPVHLAARDLPPAARGPVAAAVVAGPDPAGAAEHRHRRNL